MMTADGEAPTLEVKPPAADASSAAQKKRRTSSLFKSARQSFYRSGGKRGASVEKLRGTTGADFEATGRIHRAEEGIGCGCFGGSRDRTELLILIKGPFIFVYASETSLSPKYAISLKQLQGKRTDAETGKHSVVLETSLGDPQYEIVFDKADVADRFVKVVKEQASYAEKVEVRKKLGHEHLLSKRASVKFAEQIATEKCKEAPPKPEEMRMDANDLNMMAGPM